MVGRRGFLYFTMVICYCLPLGDIVTASPDNPTLFSQSTAALFVQQARQIHRQDPLDPQITEQAMTFLSAATVLDSASDAIAEQILRIGADNCLATQDYSERLRWALDRQVTAKADLYVLTETVRCLLEQQNSRLDREVLLEQLLNKYAPRNEAFASELATQLGLLAVEKADTDSALDWLSYAYQLNPYNQLAFVKLQELSSNQDLSVKPEVYVLQLRRSIDLNPYDLNNILTYADTLKRMRMYETAGQAYEYAARLFELLYPDKPLDDGILLSWMLSCYHTPRQESKCLQIADQYRDPDHFNMMLEAIAGRAALKLGQTEKGKVILEAAGKKAERMLSEKDLLKPIHPEQLAWFYSFALERPEEALAWANRAYKEAPQREGVQAIFAYALAQSGQMDLAEEYAEPLQQDSQIAALVMALAALDKNEDQTAMERLRETIAMMPESLVAEKALQRLRSHGSSYTDPVSMASIEEALNTDYGDRVVPTFVTPDKRFTAKLLFNGSAFFYDTEFSPKLTIENTGSSPMIIGPGSFLQGGLRIDARLSGDLNVDLPDLLTMQFRPSRPILPGQYVAVSLPLNAGRLRKLLQTYPQADVDIEFSIYLDPAQSKDGHVQSSLPGTEPVQGQLHRNGIVLTRDFLLQRLDSLAKGQQGQQLRAIRLFAGLLAEQQAFATSGTHFKHIRVEPTLLIDAVRRGLRDENWKIRIQALDSLLSLGISPNAGLLEDISANLNDDQWPVRMMALVLLTREQGGAFQQVLNWTAVNDSYPLIRRMAMALGATAEVNEP